VKKYFYVLLILISVNSFAQELFNERALIQNLKILSSDSMQGRKTGKPGNLMAAEFIKTQFEKLGIQPFEKTFNQSFEFETKSGKTKGINLVGVIKGKSSTEKYIVVSAHYDHLGVRNENTYNGTDDNASGACAIVSIAEYFSKNQPEHSIIIVAFDAEEMGLQGAKAFVQNPPVDINKIILNINLDMVSRADNNALIACGTFYYPQLKLFIEKVESVGNIRFRFSNDNPEKFKGKDNWTNSSDHGPFHKAKIPFVYFGVDDHADYHQPTDDFDKVNPNTYISCVKMILNSVIEFDKGLK
jgi:Zn-dependent M28 family amino/carboxypeptidase